MQLNPIQSLNEQQQLNRARLGLDPRAAHNIMCFTYGKMSMESTTVFSREESRKWFDTEGERIKQAWGTKITDSIVANRALFHAFEVGGDDLQGIPGRKKWRLNQ